MRHDKTLIRFINSKGNSEIYAWIISNWYVHKYTDTHCLGAQPMIIDGSSLL